MNEEKAIDLPQAKEKLVGYDVYLSNSALLTPLECEQKPKIIIMCPNEKAMGDIEEILQALALLRQPAGKEASLPKGVKDKGQWKLTLDEYVTKHGKKGQDLGVQKAFFGLNHRKWVQWAVDQGKPVPREVLEEYKSEKWAQEALTEKPVEKKPYKMPKESNQKEQLWRWKELPNEQKY